jgi:hypothetical protein
MSPSPKDEYVSNVIRQVKFPFDRKDIAKELKSHIEELESYYLEKGIDSDEAQKFAVEEMGNSLEVGNALNQVHKPLFGWLWIASKYLFIASVCFSIYITGMRVYASWQGSIEKAHPEIDAETIFQRSGFGVGTISILFDKAIDQKIKLSGNTIIFERILLNKDGTLVILYQDLKRFDPFGLDTGEYPLEQLSTLVLPSGSEFRFNKSFAGNIEGFKLLIIQHMGVDDRTFTFVLNDALNTYRLTFKGE